MHFALICWWFLEAEGGNGEFFKPKTMSIQFSKLRKMLFIQASKQKKINSRF